MWFHPCKQQNLIFFSIESTLQTEKNLVLKASTNIHTIIIVNAEKIAYGIKNTDDTY